MAVIVSYFSITIQLYTMILNNKLQKWYYEKVDQFQEHNLALQAAL
jgi:hypothetical protein